jgi:prevent-host-death family protein
VRTFTIDEAQENLGNLLDAAEAGEEILILRAGRSVARLIGLPAAKRPIGLDDGAIGIPADFDCWIPPEFTPYL